MKQLKTILEWLQQAKNEGYEWAESAINQIECDNPLEFVDKMSESVLSAFTWRTSIEGLEYWIDICNGLKKQGK